MIKQTMDNDKIQYFIVMGDHRLTEPSFTEELQMQLLTIEKWKIMVNVIAIIVEKMMQLNTNKLEGYRDGSYSLNEALKPYETESL